MGTSCVNPFCSCRECRCEPPCTCGLVQVGHTTDETWDGGALELRYTVTSRYRPRAPSEGGGHGHGGGAPGGGGEPVELADPADLLELSADAEGRRTNVLARRSEDAMAVGGHAGHPSIRSAVHKGHRIEVHTTYRVLVDGQELDAHMGVNDDGNVHYHGLPNYSTASALDLVREVIDSFPEDYPPRGEAAGPADRPDDPGDDEDHEHGAQGPEDHEHGAQGPEDHEHGGDR
jgi:hypothetical protein